MTVSLEEWRLAMRELRDPLGNVAAQEGVDVCDCGCKYWENDRCVDCGEGVQ